jgi:hypothetical protein
VLVNFDSTDDDRGYLKYPVSPEVNIDDWAPQRHRGKLKVRFNLEMVPICPLTAFDLKWWVLYYMLLIDDNLMIISRVIFVSTSCSF